MKVQKGGNIEESNSDVNNEQNSLEAPSTDNQPSWWGRITGIFSFNNDNSQSNSDNNNKSDDTQPMTGGKKKRKVTKRNKCKQKKTARKPRSKKH